MGFGAPARSDFSYSVIQLFNSELRQQQTLRRLEILEGDRFVVEALVQRCEIGQNIVLRTPGGRSRLDIFGRRLSRRFRLLAITLDSCLLLLSALAVALGTTVAAQSGRTFCASSPLRPGATSNSTLWPSTSDL